MRKLFIFAVLMPLLIGSANAKQVKNPSAIVGDCGATSSNLEYTACWRNRARVARSKADAAYARARRIGEKSDLQESYGGEPRHWLSISLRDSQTAWVKKLDRQCLFEGRIARGGTGRRALEAKCQYRLSRERIDELENAMQLIEGNS